MKVPFLNLAAQFESIRDEALPAVEAVLAGGHYVLGPNLAAFEEEFARFIGAGFAVGVNSGSDALTLALRVLDIGKGDEVITSPFTYIAPAEAIHQMGARIVFADIDARTFNISPREIARKTTARTRAIIPVHLFGQAAPLKEILEFAGTRGLEVVEDCAQAVGATCSGRRLGSFGRLGCFSFYPTKNLGAAGDGGMVVTDDEFLAKKLRMLRVHGIEQRYRHDRHGYNSRLDEVQAAILRIKLPRLIGWNRRRVEIAARYTEGLKDLPLELPHIAPGNDHVYHVFAVLVGQGSPLSAAQTSWGEGVGEPQRNTSVGGESRGEEGAAMSRRDALQRHLAGRGIPTIIYYPQPLHLQKVYVQLGHRRGDLPVSESVAARILPLPMYSELTDEQVEHVIASIRKFFENCG